MPARPAPTSVVGTLAGEALYERCAAELATDLASGDVQPGTRLPSERTLATALGYTRLTVRRALFHLAESGVIVPARRGWQVADRQPRLSDPPNTLTSFTAMAAERGLRASAKVLSVVVRPATIDEATELRVAPGDDLVEARRLRSLNDQPIAVERLRLPAERMPWLTDFDWTQSIHAALDSHNVAPTNASVRVDVVAASGEIATLLGVSEGRGVLRLVGTTSDSSGMPVCLDDVRYHPDRYQFQATLQRATPTSRSSGV